MPVVGSARPVPAVWGCWFPSKQACRAAFHFQVSFGIHASITLGSCSGTSMTARPCACLNKSGGLYLSSWHACHVRLATPLVALAMIDAQQQLVHCNAHLCSSTEGNADCEVSAGWCCAVCWTWLYVLCSCYAHCTAFALLGGSMQDPRGPVHHLKWHAWRWLGRGCVQGRQHQRQQYAMISSTTVFCNPSRPPTTTPDVTRRCLRLPQNHKQVA